MADTQTTPATDASNKRERDVVRDFEVFDSLPPAPPRSSIIEDSLQEVMEQAPGKIVCIAKYNTAAAATGAANNIRHRHGNNPDVEGWSVRTRKVNDGRTGLFVQYDPSLIVPGKKEEHEAAEVQRKAEEKAKRVKKAAEKAKTENKDKSDPRK